MQKLHLLDATYELFRAFFAMPREQGPDGREVGAIRGLIGTMLALLRQPEVTHIAAATDHVIESFRNNLFSGYKSGAGVAPELLSQFSLAEEALRALGVTVWPMIEFEADDALATGAAHFVDQVEQVVILSPDKDLCQCVRGERVVVHDRRKGTTLDAAAVQAKFGVPPQLIPDLLALVGDAADGIPGIPGWGMKTAATVLRAHGIIEHIPDEATQWNVRVRNAAAPAAALRARRPEALLYKQLATLRTDVPLREELADLEWRGVPRGPYQELCHRLGFQQLAERPTRWAAE
ncbi:MAG: polymerase [Deltaproteobacteria bacterium]|nr:polymerase [Deltaproteobacteria bacterium]